MRQQLKAVVGLGFGLRELCGTAQLSVRFTGGTRKSQTLSIQWRAENAPEIVSAAVRTAKHVRNGGQLRKAVRQSQLEDNTAPRWVELVDLYRQHRCTTLRDLSDSSWKKKYKPPLSKLEQLDPDGPKDCLRAVAAQKDDPGTRGRQLRLQATAAFLRWCVEEDKLGADWQPPSAARYLGRATEEPDHKGALPIPDAVLVELLEGLSGPFWLAVATLAVTGARPWELRHMSVNPDGTIGIGKGKTYSGGRTRPRDVVPFAPEGSDPLLTKKVMAGLVAGGLPALGKDDSRVATYLNVHLYKQEAWQRLCQGENRYSLYSLRKAYGFRLSLEGFPVRHAAALLGHSTKTHLAHYGETDARAAVAYALERAQA